MKPGYITTGAFFALAMTTLGTLPAAAQQASAPASETQNAADSAYLARMAAVVKASTDAQALNLDAVSGVFNDAVQAKVSQSTMDAMVSMVSKAFPTLAPDIAGAAVKSYGVSVTKAQVTSVFVAAVTSTSNPSAIIDPTSQAIEKALGHLDTIVQDMHEIVQHVKDTAALPAEAVASSGAARSAQSTSRAESPALFSLGDTTTTNGLSTGGTAVVLDPVRVEGPDSAPPATSSATGN